MNEKEEGIPKKEALRQVKLGVRRAALIYHYFSKIVVEELGEKRGVELIKRAINAYGTHIGNAARDKTLAKGRPLIPENFESDLPDLAWEGEKVTADGEERYRVYNCPLAKEWIELGEQKWARLYCFVDQAKMKGFNPGYEYVHIKNILDGDPYCELVVRPVSKNDSRKPFEG